MWKNWRLRVEIDTVVAVFLRFLSLGVKFFSNFFFFVCDRVSIAAIGPKKRAESSLPIVKKRDSDSRKCHFRALNVNFDAIPGASKTTHHNQNS
jgi:hypothetical protein